MIVELIFLLINTKVSYCQEVTDKIARVDTSNGIYNYLSLDVQPCFRGGVDSLRKHVDKYKFKILNTADIEGFVCVSFIVNTEGKAQKPRIMGDKMPKFVKSFLNQMVEKMPPWTPGIKNGLFVNSVIVIPIYLVIDN